MEKLTDREIFVFAVAAVEDAVCNPKGKRKMNQVFKDAIKEMKRIRRKEEVKTLGDRA